MEACQLTTPGQNCLYRIFGVDEHTDIVNCSVDNILVKIYLPVIIAIGAIISIILGVAGYTA